MNILYILGNGFDIAQGMKTRYSDFYKFLNEHYNDCSEVLKALLDDINEDIDNWSDMEKAFGLYTNIIGSKEEFIQLHGELCLKLREYFLNEEENSWVSKYEKNLESGKGFFLSCETLYHPESYLREGNKRKFRELWPSYRGKPKIYVVSFNYTSTFEHLYGIRAGRENIDEPGEITQIIHIHGSFDSDEPIIMGVDNKKQIGSYSFKFDNRITDIFVKNALNNALNNARPDDFTNLIKKSDVIVMYGVSMGDTDDRWWKIIGKEFTNRKLIIIRFLYEKNRNNTNTQLGHFENEQLEYTMYKMGFRKNLFRPRYPIDYKDRLFLYTNSNIFDRERLEKMMKNGGRYSVE